MSRVRRWVVEGPNESDGTLGWMVAHMCHWRMWATMALAALPLLAGVFALQHTEPFWAIVVTTIVAGISHDEMMKVSPKYDVTKNY